jgi:hypothetical protein
MVALLRAFENQVRQQGGQQRGLEQPVVRATHETFAEGSGREEN